MACEGLCAPSSFYLNLATDATLSEQYARARETRADARFEALDGVIVALQAGQIDPASARVMVDTIKWQCAHEKPKRYSDRVDLTHSSPDGGPVDTRVTVEYIDKASPSADGFESEEHTPLPPSEKRRDLISG